MGYGDDSSRRMPRALSETDLRDLVVPKVKNVKKNNGILSEICVEEEEDIEKEESGLEWWRTASFGVDEGCGVGGGGGKFCGGGGSDGGDNEDSWNSNNGNHGTDLYYQKMIEANPGNSLLLSNYAKFLKEVTLFVYLFIYSQKEG